MYSGIEDKVMTVCPHCGSTKIRKAGWLPSGYQRYHCRNCNKKISILTTDKYYRTSDTQCPYCESYRTKVAGRLKDGTRRHTCKNCGKSFSAKTVIKEEITETCPHCGSSNLRREGRRKGGQRYYCKDCNRAFMPNKKEYAEVECPKCHNTHVVKWKMTGKSGRPYYYCQKCQHKFMEGGKLLLTQEQIEEIKMLYEKGAQVKALAKKYKKSEATIRRKVATCDHLCRIEKAVSLLPLQTKRDIVYFGLGAQVSVKDMSDYFKVDKEVVEKVMQNYKDKYYEK